MKSDRQRILALLYRLFDDELSPTETEELEAALAGSESLRRERDEILKLRQDLVANRTESFGPFFAERVMQRLQPTASPVENFAEGLMRLFRPVAIVGAATVVLLIVLNIYTGDGVSIPTALGYHEPEIYSAWETPLDQILGGS